MFAERTTRRELLHKSAAGAAALAGANALAPAIDAAAPRGHGEAKEELVYWDWWSPVGSPALTRWFNWVKKTFEKENPGVTVKYQFLPWGDPYLQKLQAAVAAGTPPDVFHNSVAWAYDLWDRNVLYKMNDLIAMSPDLQFDKFFPSARFYASKNGAIFGIPMEGPDSDCIMMNVDLIARLTGWPAKTRQDVMAWPDRIKTWDDFTKLAVTLTRRTGGKLTVAGFNVPDLSSLDWFASLLASNGAHFYTSDYSSVNLNTPQALECAQWMLDLQKKYKVSQPPNAQRNDEHELLAGNAAMIADGTWGDYQMHDSNPDFRLMMMPIPRGPHGTKKGTVTFTNMVSMARNVKNPALAWKFATFMSGLSTQLSRLQILARFAPLRSFFGSQQWQTAVLHDPALAEVPKMAEIGDVYPFVHSAELFDKVGPVMTEISVGEVTPQVGLAKAQKVAESILSGI